MPRETPVLGLSERWSLARSNVASPITVIYHATLPANLITQDQLKDAASRLNARDRLTLLIDHIICDGLGARNLFSDLLSILSDQPIPQQPEGLPARMDDTVELQPSGNNATAQSKIQSTIKSLSNGINTIVSPESVYTNCPTLQSPGYNSITASQQFSHFSLSPSELSSLIAEGKKHNVPTIHPVIHIASIVALYRALQSTSGYSFFTSIPISERNAALGHPRSTGNYVTFHFSTDRISHSTKFWDQVRDFSATLRQPETKITARHTLGKLAAINGEEELDENAPSKWEDYLYNVMSDSNGPHKLSLAVSNVGLADLPTLGKLAGQVEDVYFQQAASAMGGCAVLSIMSTRGGALTCSISSKIGSMPPGVFESFAQRIKPILQAIARGDISEDATAGGAIPGVLDVGNT
ncbi:uncharacterized protein L201_000002 [Kwoniella dendrophila CBS 6074]|uniref:Alcohol acetyltransferase n=1 Tax=Kwoniella dendrophila CBS 6074 TaxID=1295534 RepID=A0AAX4JKV4_9TREE